MSAPETIQPDGWPAPKGYANGMLAPAGARILAISGQIGWDTSEQLVAESLVPQFAQALRNVLAVLEAAGGGPEHLLRLTYYVLDREDYRRNVREIGRHYRDILGKHYPASALLEVQGLLEPGALVEIEAQAALPAS